MTTGRYLATVALAVAFSVSTLAVSKMADSQPAGKTMSKSLSADVVKALKEEIAHDPGNDKLISELSRACAVLGDKQGALAAIRRALELKPDKVEYLRAGGQLASWNGEYTYALELYYRILSIRPDDGQAQIGLARVENWLGKVDRSARDYKAYIAKHPKDRKARIEYAQVITWRGGYAEAMDILKGYFRDFGADDDYKRQKALVLALARRSNASLAISKPMFEQHPGDYNLVYARTIALANGRRPSKALKSLGELEALNPSDPLTTNTALYVKTPLRSTLAGNFRYSHDSDDLSIWSYSVATKLKLSPVTFIRAGGRWDDLSARAASGLERIDGGIDSWLRSGWLGLTHRFSSYASADFTVGGSEAQSGKSIFTYQAGLDLNPADNIALRISRSYGYYLISPRALSLNMRETSNRLDMRSDIGLRYHLDAYGAYRTVSDGNRIWDLSVAPRREIARTGSFNFDLGLRGWWFGFNNDYGHGYYAPSQYQRYAATAFGYWKISDNDGVGFVVAPGYFKDNITDRFKFGLDWSVQATFGIYRDWMLQVSLSRVVNNRIASGAYQGTTAQISIVRRF